jgi:signal transduction histidine kinase
MASAINSLALDDLCAALAALGETPVPLLVVRFPVLEKVAWRKGLRAARTTERNASEAFARATAGVVRGGDLVAHDGGSDVFVAALCAPTRTGGGCAPLDSRSALARIVAAVEAASGLQTESGWTTFAAGQMELAESITEALAGGARERERYAFFSALGHELRTPLASIRGYLETLLDGEVEAETRRRFLRIAHGESLRLSRLVDGMFEISLLDMRGSGGRGMPGRLDLALGAAHDACAAGAAARDVALRLPPAPAELVAIDTDRLTLVLANVIDNAVKHGRRGGRVAIALQPSERSVTIFVDDDGDGVPLADRERIFALGERGATGAPGSGIGLALVRLILERAGGRIAVERAPAGGARFSIALLRAAAMR